jgi:hypothetical protein
MDLGPAPAALREATPPEAPAALEPAPPEPPTPEAEFGPPPEGAAFVEVDEAEQVFEEEERDPEDAEALDPEAALDARPDLDVIVAERLAGLDAARDAAEAAALSGEQRVRLTDPAGPGTLAEALARLEISGRVTSRLEEDEDGAPVMIYRPVAPPAGDDAPAT